MACSKCLFLDDGRRHIRARALGNRNRAQGFDAGQSFGRHALASDRPREAVVPYFAVNSDLTRELIPHLGETLIVIRLRGRMSCPGQPPRTDDDART